MNFFTRLLSKYKATNNTIANTGTTQHKEEIVKILNSSEEQQESVTGNKVPENSSTQYEEEITEIFNIPPRLQKIDLSKIERMMEKEYLTFHNQVYKHLSIEKSNGGNYGFVSSKFEQINTMVHDIIKTGKELKDSSFLDIGCGIPFVSHLMDKIGTKEVVGLEYSKMRVETAKKHFPDILVHQEDLFTFSKYKNYDILYTYNPIKDPEGMYQALVHIIENMKIGATLYFSNVTFCDEILVKSGFEKLRQINSTTNRDLINGNYSKPGEVIKYTKISTDFNIVPLTEEVKEIKKMLAIKKKENDTNFNIKTELIHNLKTSNLENTSPSEKKEIYENTQDYLVKKNLYKDGEILTPSTLTRKQQKMFKTLGTLNKYFSNTIEKNLWDKNRQEGHRNKHSLKFNQELYNEIVIYLQNNTIGPILREIQETLFIPQNIPHEIYIDIKGSLEYEVNAEYQEISSRIVPYLEHLEKDQILSLRKDIGAEYISIDDKYDLTNKDILADTGVEQTLHPKLSHLIELTGEDITMCPMLIKKIKYRVQNIMENHYRKLIRHWKMYKWTRNEILKELQTTPTIKKAYYDEGYSHRESKEFEILALVMDIIKEPFEHKKFIDIGCGLPLLPEIIRQSGLNDVNGLEENQALVKIAKKSFPNIKVQQSEMLTFQHYNKYDILYLYRPLENEYPMYQTLHYIIGNMKENTSLYFNNAQCDPKKLEKIGFKGIKNLLSEEVLFKYTKPSKKPR